MTSRVDIAAAPYTVIGIGVIANGDRGYFSMANKTSHYLSQRRCLFKKAGKLMQKYELPDPPVYRHNIGTLLLVTGFTEELHTTPKEVEQSDRSGVSGLIMWADNFGFDVRYFEYWRSPHNNDNDGVVIRSQLE